MFSINVNVFNKSYLFYVSYFSSSSSSSTFSFSSFFFFSASSYFSSFSSFNSSSSFPSFCFSSFSTSSSSSSLSSSWMGKPKPVHVKKVLGKLKKSYLLVHLLQLHFFATASSYKSSLPFFTLPMVILGQIKLIKTYTETRLGCFDVTAILS